MIRFDGIKTEKPNFDYSKRTINIKNEIGDKIIISNKISFGKKDFKYFIGYKGDEKVKLLYMLLPKRSGYKDIFDEAKYKSFLVKENELLKTYSKIWDKVSNSIKNRIWSQTIVQWKIFQNWIWQQTSVQWKISQN